jgi:hypothetical protein
MRLSLPSLMLNASLLLLAPACVSCGDTSITAPAVPTNPTSRDSRTQEMDIVIQVSPATLILDSPGTWVTVHAEIAYSAVDQATLTMNDVELVYSKSDNRGELVVKFAREDIQDIVSPPQALLTLTGLTISGDVFTGSAMIPVQ